ncbi:MULTISPECIES: PTS glucitol/sorbitol transporter subunit IIA [Bacillaceae]|uniref:PTS glucitol/sorbitol transporter subunit IIA n=1 Tax=Bacillaceae TaxID=186817 RepID=UPI001E4C8A32|nr:MULTISPECIES: PTS glucitol/sorbitol transporter subunit IIA [Bacillaceae]MCE4047617.1 PTS glucitol/sorbitol transporter subunit IIA [Bacillus sp. Au-Bac7]MCM3031063.1 PTS glucitol/sorbitol transporter subunit IIA [Niallia sp. MER 6]MDL0437356.1 PTS glucitol/sorbitol transporter subunit IIA [Niallia sp. SS-2023]UPO86041.1 PTS glucitol/sorbitol transporter subunit IIA [Niallia sp. Man26]
MTTSVVKEIGVLVSAFKEDKILILFGPQAPKELREMAVIHEFELLDSEPLKHGGTIAFGDETFTITALGDHANKNFKELGHISIYFQEPVDEVLPGAVFAAPYSFPNSINEGTVISVK